MRTESYINGTAVVNGHDAWALFEACRRGDLPLATSLLDQDPNLVNAQHWYQFPIHMAVRGGHAELVRLLLARGADPGQSVFTYNSWDKLLEAAKDRGLAEIEALLADAMRTRFRYAPEFAELRSAIVSRDRVAVRTVVQNRPDLLQTADALGNGPLHWSIITRQLDLLSLLVESGAPLEAMRADGQTPLLLAANGAQDYWYRETRDRSHPSLRNTWIMVGQLLALGAQYSFSVAAAAGDQERVELLLREDQTENLARNLNSARRSPLSFAAREGHAHLVRLLLAHGADPNQPEDGAPHGLALFNACSRNHQQVATILLEHGANPNAGFDSSGCCLTICEVYHGRQAKPLQTLLRKYGATTPPYAMTTRQLEQALRENEPVVQHAEFLGHAMAHCNARLLDAYLEADPALPQRLASCGLAYPRSPALIRKLLDRGLDPNQADWLGRTLLHACAANGDHTIAAVLLDAGADANAREDEFSGTPLATAVRVAARHPPSDETLQRRQWRMMRCLRKYHAAIHLPDDPPWATPTAWALKHGRDDLVAWLKRRS